MEKIVSYEAGKPIELVARDYGVAASDVVKLASNENPFGASEKVRAKLAAIVNQTHRYPDDSYFALKAAIANKYNMNSKNIIIGSGSDQIFEFISHVILERGDIVLQNKIDFAMYAIYTAQAGGETLRAESEIHDLNEFEKLLAKDPKIIYLCTPANPLGNAMDRDEIYKFLPKVNQNSLVVIDAAYMEFAAYKDAKKHIEPRDVTEKFPNVIYTGTFSKAYGLGGMRVGYGIANEKIIKELHKMRAPFNITTLSLAAAIEAIGDQEFVQKTITHNFAEMEKYEKFARDRKIKYIESYTNFITFFFDRQNEASEIAQKLLKNGMIVRDLKSYGLNAIRVTIGLEAENAKFMKLFDEARR